MFAFPQSGLATSGSPAYWAWLALFSYDKKIAAAGLLLPIRIGPYPLSKGNTKCRLASPNVEGLAVRDVGGCFEVPS